MKSISYCLVEDKDLVVEDLPELEPESSGRISTLGVDAFEVDRECSC